MADQDRCPEHGNEPAIWICQRSGDYFPHPQCPFDCDCEPVRYIRALHKKPAENLRGPEGDARDVAPDPGQVERRVARREAAAAALDAHLELVRDVEFGGFVCAECGFSFGPGHTVSKEARQAHAVEYALKAAEDKSSITAIASEVAVVERRWRGRVEGLADRFGAHARRHRAELGEAREKLDQADYLAAAEAFEDAERDVRSLLADRDDNTSDEGAGDREARMPGSETREPVRLSPQPSVPPAGNATPDRQSGEGSIADGPSPEVMGDLSPGETADDKPAITAHTPDLPDEILEQAAETLDACLPLTPGALTQISGAVAVLAPVLVEHGRQQERERIKRDLYALPTHDRPQTDASVDIDGLLEGSVDPGRSIDQRIREAEARGAATERERIREKVQKLVKHRCGIDHPGLTWNGGWESALEHVLAALDREDRA